MSTTHKQLTVMLDSIFKIYRERHIVFSLNGAFDMEGSVLKAVSLFQTIQSYKDEVRLLKDLPVDETFGNECVVLMDKMMGNRDTFFKSVNDLQILLNARLPLKSRSILANASPLNRQVMEVLNEQVQVVLDKQEELLNNNDPFDEDAFAKANDGLFFSREVYIEQLRTNLVSAKHADLAECKTSNTTISKAVGNNFVATIKATDALLESKIKSEQA